MAMTELRQSSCVQLEYFANKIQSLGLGSRERRRYRGSGHTFTGGEEGRSLEAHSLISFQLNAVKKTRITPSSTLLAVTDFILVLGRTPCRTPCHWSGTLKVFLELIKRKSLLKTGSLSISAAVEGLK